MTSQFPPITRRKPNRQDFQPLALSALLLGAFCIVFSPWIDSAVGQLSGSTIANLWVSFGHSIPGFPPRSIGWFFVGLPFVLSASILMVAFAKRVSSALAIFSSSTLFIILVLTARTSGRRPLIAWWLGVTFSILSVISAVFVWRQPRNTLTRSSRSKYWSVALGIILLAVSVWATVHTNGERSSGSKSPESAAEEMVLAALNGDRVKAARMLDPEELTDASTLLNEIGDRLVWLDKLRDVLGGPTNSVNEVRTTSSALPDGAVGVRIDSLLSNSQPSEAGTVESAIRKLGFTSRPTLVVVERNGRWYVNGSESVKRAASSLIGALGG